MDRGPRAKRGNGHPQSPSGGPTVTPQADLGSLGDRIWLVLGGGGLKGLAHIGAWRALRETGVRVAGVVGTSIGALVGALIASGAEWKEMRRLARALKRTDIVRVNRRAVLFNGIHQVSVFRGDVLQEYYASIFADTGWETLGIPLLVNAVDLATGRTEWFGAGARTDVSLTEALYASSALPVLYPPARIGDTVLVDGGTEHPLALGRAAETDATGLIGVDVGAGETGEAHRIVEQGMVAVHQRIFAIMTWRRRNELVRHWQGKPLLYVRPALDGFGTFDFDRIEHFLEEGYRAMSRALL